MVKVGINGFGRIGRNVLRAALGRSDFDVVAINDLTDSKTLAHLLKYDTLSGTLAARVEAGDNQLLLDGRPIQVFSQRDPAEIPWSSVGVDVVIEATGFFTDKAKAEVHITQRRRQAGDYLGAGQERRHHHRHGGLTTSSTIRRCIKWSATAAAPPTGWHPPRRCCIRRSGIEYGLMNTTQPIPTARRCTISRKKICAARGRRQSRSCLTPAVRPRHSAR